MNRESAAWAVIGFLAASLMGAMGATEGGPGRWQLMITEDHQNVEMVVFDTATGAVWAKPHPFDSMIPRDWAAVAKNCWVQIGPAR